ncbi:MAG: ribosomal protein [Verrucomicrobiales bacterium]|nr:ribosomal protein [Verrucomicrobiales bacterium]
MKSVSLTAFSRSVVKRTGVKKLRSAGRVPAVIYGGQTKPQNLEIGVKDLENVVHHSASENVLLDLAVNGASHLALIKEIQHNPLTGEMLHVDLHAVSANEKVTISVPVEPTGEAVGVKTGGGVLEHVVFKLKIRATPKDLPEVIYVDVAALEIGKSIHLSEITLPPGVEALGKKNILVFTVAAPVTEAQEAAAEAAAGPAEVEMIKEKKEDGEAAPAKAGDKAAEKAPAKGDEKKPAEKKK